MAIAMHNNREIECVEFFDISGITDDEIDGVVFRYIDDPTDTMHMAKWCDIDLIEDEEDEF